MVTNSGAGTARDVTVTDQLPDAAGLAWTENSDDCAIDDDGLMTCDFGDIDPGDDRSVSLSSPTSSASCGTIDNTAMCPTTNDGSDDSSASVVWMCATISIEKTADEDAVSARAIRSGSRSR